MSTNDAPGANPTEEVCTYCGQELGVPLQRSDVVFTLSRNKDHFIPRASGGSDDPGNYPVICCDVCNGFKAAKVFASIESASLACRTFWESVDDITAVRIQLAAEGRRSGAKRGGARSGPVNGKLRMANVTQEQQAAYARLGAAALTFEQRSAAGKVGGPAGGRARAGKMSPEERKAAAVYASSFVKPQSRSKAGKLGYAAGLGKLTHEQLSEASKRRKVTKEQLSAWGKSSGGVGGRKGTHTRWHVRRGIRSQNCVLCMEEIKHVD